MTIQFPDPWFKKKHAKRRMVNEELVETIAVNKLAIGGRVFVQTDIEFLAEEMFDLFRDGQGGWTRSRSRKSVSGENGKGKGSRG